MVNQTCLFNDSTYIKTMSSAPYPSWHGDLITLEETEQIHSLYRIQKLSHVHDRET